MRAFQSRWPFCCGLALLTVGLASAQQVSEPRAFDRGTAGVWETASGLHAFGDHYKATVDEREGLRFVPALGTAARTNRPVGLRVRFCGRQSERGAELAPVQERSLNGRTVHLLRRSGVVERYEVRPDGVALSFWLPSMPVGTGDLVVSLELTTELSLLSLEDGATSDRGITLAAGTSLDRGGVHIGEVTGIDAAGERVAGSIAIRSDAGRRVIDLRLPAAFVDGATYPLVLDPLISTLLPITLPGEDAGAPDAAYDSTFGRYLCAYEVRFSDGDVDVRAVLTDDTGVVVGVSVIAGTPEYETMPRVIGVDNSDRFLVVWQESPSPLSGYDVRCRAVNANNGTASAGSPFVASGADSQEAPVVGYWGGTDEAIVVWLNDGVGLEAASVTVPASGDPAVGTSSRLINDTWAEGPAISRIVDPAGAHIVMYEGQRAGTALAVDRSLQLAQTSQVAGTAPFDIDGDGWRFVQVHRQFSQNSRIVAESLQWTGTNLLRGRTQPVSGIVDGFRPAVAIVGGKAVVAYEVDLGALFAQTIAHAQLDVDTLDLCGMGGTVSVNSTSQRSVTPRIASQASAGGDLEALIVYSTAPATPFPLARTIEGAIYAPHVGGSVNSVAPGCGPAGGTGGVNGPYALGNGVFELTLTGADPAAPLVAVSVGFPRSPLICGSCTFTVPVALTIMGQTGGAASWPLPIPCRSSLVGTNLEFQWLVLGPFAGACSMAPTVSTSDRVQLLGLDL